VARPVLRNIGVAEADSVEAILRVVSGSATVIDSVAWFGRLDPGQAEAAADSFVVCGADSAAIAIAQFEVEIRTPTRRGQEYVQAYISGGGGGGCGGIGTPQNRVAQAGGRSIALRWDPVANATHYVIYHVRPGADKFVGVAAGGSRFEVSSIDGEALEPFDENGDPIDYQFSVRACVFLHIGCAGTFESQNTWLPEVAGWPKVVPTGITTAPTVISLLQDETFRRAVVVGGREIYAWWLDPAEGSPSGSPVRGPAYPDGLFFDPDLPNDPHAVFSEKLVELPLMGDGEVVQTNIVGCVINDAVYNIAFVPSGDHFNPALAMKRKIRPLNGAPTVASLHNTGPLAGQHQIIVPGRRDTLYVWHEDTTPYISNLTGAPHGAYAVNESHGNLRSVAILPGTDVNYIVQAEHDGRVVCWETESRTNGALADELWEEDVEAMHGSSPSAGPSALSTPAVGDVDGDGDPEIVLTNHNAGCPDSECGAVFILSETDGSCEAACDYDSDWKFYSEGNEPPPRPVLACLNDDDGLEIVLGSRYGPTSGVQEHRAFVYSVDGSNLVPFPCVAPALLPYRNGVYPPALVSDRSQEAMVLDLDGDADLDILGPTKFGDLARWEFSTEEDCVAPVGWPIHFGDIVHTPTVTDLGIYVSTRDDLLHFFELPDGGAGSTVAGWSQYGFDSGNTGYHPGCDEPVARAAEGDSLTLSVLPTDPAGSQRIRFHLPESADHVELAVYDAAGRRVRVLSRGVQSAGAHEIAWDGRNDKGNVTPSGVYFYRLALGEQKAVVRKTVRMR
jgi:hypothetical protein